MHSFIRSICTSKLRLRPSNVMVVGRSVVLVRPDATKHGNALNAELQRLNNLVPKVVVAGLPNVSRAVIAVDDTVTPNRYKLCVEGVGLREVIATYGVVGTRTKSNDICEVHKTLGIEAARTTIMTEITDVMEGHGMTVDHRHIMLLAGQMTSRGDVLGITRHGLAKMRESVFNLASVSCCANGVGEPFVLNHIIVFFLLFYSSKKPLTTCSMRRITGRRIRLMAFRSVLFWVCRQQSERDCSN